MLIENWTQRPEYQEFLKRPLKENDFKSFIKNKYHKENWKRKQHLIDYLK